MTFLNPQQMIYHKQAKKCNVFIKSDITIGLAADLNVLEVKQHVWAFMVNLIIC